MIHGEGQAGARTARAQVVPLRDAGSFAPATVPIRGILERVTDEPGRIRAVDAVLAWVAEQARSGTTEVRGAWWDRAVSLDLGGCAEAMGLSIPEVEQGVQDAQEAQLLHPEGGRVRMEPSVMMALPVLAAVSWTSVRRALAPSAALGPALAVLREVARRSTREGEGPGSWVVLGREELSDAVAWGQRKVTDGLRDAQSAGLLERGKGQGLSVRLSRAAFGGDTSSTRTPALKSSSAGDGVLSLRAGAAPLTVRVGDAEMSLPAGTELELTTGAGAPRVRIHVDADGTSHIRIGETIEIGPV